MTIKELKDTAKLLADEVTAYEVKPTKASSKRIRMHLGAIKKHTTGIRKELVALDKKGY